MTDYATVTHAFDKQNFEEYLRHYLDDETITLTEKQWNSVARHIEHQVDSFYDNLLQDIKQDWQAGVFDEEGGATKFVRTLGL